MSSSMIVSTTVQVDGAQLAYSVTQTASGDMGHNDAIATAGFDGDLTTRTSDTAGTLTMDSAGHGITDDDTFCIFFTGGVSYNCIAGTVSGTSIPFTAAAGTDGTGGEALPADETAVTVGEQETVAFVVTGNNVKGLALSCNKRCHVDFQDAGGTELAREITAGGGWNWTYDSGLTNPVASAAIIQFLAASGDTTAGTLKVKCLYDDTP